MFELPPRNFDIQYRTKGCHLQNEASLKAAHELKITLYQLAIEQYSQIRDKSDNDISEISYCYYNIAVIYKTYLKKFHHARNNFQHAIDYLCSMQHPEREDIELLKDYYWQLNNSNDNYYVITNEEQDSLLSDTASERDEQVNPIARFR